MDELLETKWKSTRVGTSPLDGENLKNYLHKLENGWKIIEGTENKLTKEYKFSNFNTALKFVILVGNYADKRNHHPNIELSWGKAVVTIWTHRINGLSIMDFVYAATVEKMFFDNF